MHHIFEMKRTLLAITFAVVAASAQASFTLTWDGSDGYSNDNFYNDGSVTFAGRSTDSLVSTTDLYGRDYNTDDDGYDHDGNKTPGIQGLYAGPWGNGTDPNGSTPVGSHGQIAAGIGTFDGDLSYAPSATSSSLHAGFKIADGYTLQNMTVTIDFWTGSQYVPYYNLRHDSMWAGLASDYAGTAQGFVGGDPTWTGLNLTGNVDFAVVGAVIDGDNEPYRIRVTGDLVPTSAPVPEPASMAVLGLGALGLLKRRRKA